MSLYFYRAKVLRVIDGDTIVCDVDLGFGIWAHKQHLRLSRINSPEIGNAGGAEARDYLRLLLPADTMLLIRTEKDSREKYGRYLVTLWLEREEAPEDGNSINALMVSTGHAESTKR